MNISFRCAVITAGLGMFALLAGCGSASKPEDARLQVDDYPKTEFPKNLPPAPSKRDFGKCTARIKELGSTNKSPEMMALGGSVFNGVSSMQINWWLSDWSPPAQVARALHQKMDGPVPGLRVPPYPDYNADPFKIEGPNTTLRLGLDLETTDLDRLPSAIRHQGYAMERFERLRPGGNPFSDNLSFGGASIDDILLGTPRDYRARLEAKRRIDTIGPDAQDFWADGPQPRTYRSILEHAKRTNGLIDAGKTAGALKTIFFALNSAFVLNPTHDECLEDLTALDQVLLRQPKRLLVGVGSNSGLFTFLYTGQPINKYCGETNFSFGGDVHEYKRYVPINISSKKEFLDRMKMLLDRLEAEGSGIEHIYVMGQLRPRVVANLEPGHKKGSVGIDTKYPPGQLLQSHEDYHDEYYLSFAPDGSRRIVGDDVRAADLLNAEVNDALRDMVLAHRRQRAAPDRQRPVDSPGVVAGRL